MQWTPSITLDHTEKPQQSLTSFWCHSLDSRAKHLFEVTIRSTFRRQSIFTSSSSGASSSTHSFIQLISPFIIYMNLNSKILNSLNWPDIRQTHPITSLINNFPLPFINIIRRNHLPTATTQLLCGWAMCVTQSSATQSAASHLCFTFVPIGYNTLNRVVILH